MTQWGLDNLFNPGKRHMDDEKRRLQSTREEIGDNSGGRRIDLEGGKVSIAVRRSVTPTDDAEDAVSAPALEAEELPAVALATDDAEITPPVVDESETVDAGVPVEQQQPEVLASVAAVEAVATEAPADDQAEDDDDDDNEPIEASAPEPAVAPARRRQLSANAWARRG
ncbi:DUF6191 domain-containing protein [Jatrophihabitans sp. YIM 134969]